MLGVLKWVGIVIGALVGLIVIAIVAVFAISEIRINSTYNIQPEAVAIPTDRASIERGKRLATIRGCMDCHGGNLAGIPFIPEPIGPLYSANLTRGKGGIGGQYSDTDWIRSVRNGVRPNGKPLLFMPAQEFYYLSDADLGAIIAYVKSVPPVDNEQPPSTVGMLGRVLFVTGQFPLLAAEMVPHDAPRPTAPPPGVTAAYGEYLAIGCKGCHGENLSGGPVVGAPPEAPPAANLTPAGPLATYSETDLFRALRLGKRPDGSDLNPFMPWKLTAQMTDDEIKAVWLYLRSVPPKETGSR